MPNVKDLSLVEDIMVEAEDSFVFLISRADRGHVVGDGSGSSPAASRGFHRGCRFFELLIETSVIKKLSQDAS